MSITEFSLSRPRLTCLFVALMVCIGIYSLFNQASQEDPTILVRQAVVVSYFPGMSAKRVENLITKKIDLGIRQLPQVRNILSYSKNGESIIHINLYDKYVNLDKIWQKLRNKINDIKGQLPRGTRGPYVNDEYGDVTTATVALTAQGFSLKDMRQTAEHLRDNLYSVAGTKKITIDGVQAERIYLEANNTRLARYGLTPRALVKALREQNVLLPGGMLEVNGFNVIVEPTGNFTSLKQIRELPIKLPNSQQVVQLGNIVKVSQGYVHPAFRPIYYNGQQAIALAIVPHDDTNLVKYGHRLSAKIKQLQQELPVGYHLHFATYQPALIASELKEFMFNLGVTVVSVLLVVILILGLRGGFVAGLMVPLTLLMAIIFLYFFHIPFHRVSIAGLIISLGLLVDNGIVITENISCRMAAGEKAFDAAIAAAKELMFPLLVSSLTIILVFMPVMFSISTASDYIRPLSKVILITLLCSWILALYVIPLFSIWVLKPSKDNKRQAAEQLELSYTPEQNTKKEQSTESAIYQSGFYEKYRACLKFCIRNRLAVLVLTILLLFIAVGVIRARPKAFFPNLVRAQYLIYVDLPTGSSIKKTDESVQSLSKWLNNKKLNPDVVSNMAYVGYGGTRFFLTRNPLDPDPHRGVIIVNLKKGTNPLKVLPQARQYVLDHYPGLKTRFKRFFLGGSETGLIQVRIYGPNPDKLKQYALKVAAGLRKVPHTYDIDDDWGQKVYRVKVNIDQAKARRFGISSADVANSLNSYISGTAISSYREGDKLVPIVVRSETHDTNSLDRLRTMQVFAANGQSVPLLQIATFKPVVEFPQLVRYNLRRSITVSAVNTKLGAYQAVKELQGTLDKLNLKKPYYYELDGEVKLSGESQSSLFGYLPLCFMLIFVLLVWQFNSYRKVLTIFFSIVISMIGAAAGLFVMQANFGFMAILGILSLCGITANQVIVLISKIATEEAAGKSSYDAVLAAAVTRLRPIVITSLTTIIGLIPLLVFGGKIWYEMLSTIIFGLSFGIFATLFIIPAFYTLIFRTKRDS